jgi:hypothetical protein
MMATKMHPTKVCYIIGPSSRYCFLGAENLGVGWRGEVGNLLRDPRLFDAMAKVFAIFCADSWLIPPQNTPYTSGGNCCGC